MKKCFLFGALLLVIITGCSSATTKDGSSKVEQIAEVEKLLSTMTIEEKVGQMAQVTIDVLTVGENAFHTAEPVQLDKAMLRKAIVDYKIGSVLNTPNKIG